MGINVERVRLGASGLGQLIEESPQQSSAELYNLYSN